MSKWIESITFDKANSIKPPNWPNEFLVKLLCSTSYSEIPKFLPRRARVLEVGIFSGNNARLFADLGFEIYGTEVNNEMVRFAISNLEEKGIKYSEVAPGKNDEIPFKETFFDLLVSINTIHYSSGETMNKAISEFARVLRPNGFCIIETPADTHYIHKQSQRLGELQFIWQSGGFREGQSMGFFDNPLQFKEKLQQSFEDVKVLSRSEEYEKTSLAWWVAVCQKRSHT